MKYRGDTTLQAFVIKGFRQLVQPVKPIFIKYFSWVDRSRLQKVLAEVALVALNAPKPLKIVACETVQPDQLQLYIEVTLLYRPLLSRVLDS